MLMHIATPANRTSQSFPMMPGKPVPINEKQAPNNDHAIDARYGKIGIAAVAAAVRYAGDARNITDPADAFPMAPAPSNIVTTGMRRMENPPKPVAPEPQVHVFCPSCGELATPRAMRPRMFNPSMDEITYSCAACGTETKVQLTKHARFSIDVNQAEYFRTQPASGL
jgi:predicted RNA-binding Zn-ribbon protein involved in translation (DUF1610 family)